MHMHLGKPAKLTLALLFMGALWLAGLYAFTRGVMAEAPAYKRPADAIVVLTGGTKRLETGFALLEKGMGKKLFISGVYRGVEVKELLARLKREDAERLNCCVELGFEADDTIGNAREATAWLRREGFRTYFLVTSNYHLRRATLDFKAFAPELKPFAYPVAPEGLDMKNWWRDSTARGLVLREYMKYLAGFLWRPLVT